MKKVESNRACRQRATTFRLTCKSKDSAPWPVLWLALRLMTGLAVVGSCGAGEPILQWRFDGAASPGQWWGQHGAPTAGPRPPRYPGFAADNLGMSFVGHEGAILVKDHERGGFANVRFGAGDTFGFETWVKFQAIAPGQIVYVVGKGRHIKHGEDFPEANQNYSIRFLGTGGGAQFGLLFTSEHPESGKRAWHRWWSDRSVPLSGWHHVALQFTFGQADSLRAWLDGQAVEGKWSESGATDLPPVQDADDLVVGTGYARGEGSSFRGALDNLCIYRAKLDAVEIAGRFQYVPPPPPVQPTMVPPGKVLMQISEKGVPEANGWPEEPEVTETYEEEVFGFFETPHKYVATGVRGDRANPTHLRAAANVVLPAGTHRILLRGRGTSRLFIDNVKVLETAPRPTDSGGHTPLAAQDEYLDLGPDFRFAPPGNREVWCEFPSQGGEHFVILETMLGNVIGKRKQRPELGETVVAISHSGSDQWQLLAPGDRHVAYTDEGWAAYESERREWLAVVNARARAECRETNRSYWDHRRTVAQQWLSQTKDVEVPELPAGLPANNPVDHFIGAKIEEARRQTRELGESEVDYYRDVRPILEARCFDCHQGGKAKGGLRLDDRPSVLAGGDSGLPAIVPKSVDQSELMQRVAADDGGVMPPRGEPLSEEEIQLLGRWIKSGASWPQFQVTNLNLTPLTDDLVFLRRATLDTVGVAPSEEEVEEFLADPPDARRQLAIARLLADPRWADHWMGYWLDVLAENPNMINPTLNNTGPFRWWLYESLVDNKPADLMVTELIRMEGSERFGGPAGFGIATQNDLPMAAKGIIVSSAFLGVEMKCARCHDAPAHVSRQEDLMQLAAMLKQRAIKLPMTSSVPGDRLHQAGREPLIEVTLKPDAVVAPGWPFERYCDDSIADRLAEHPDRPRDRLATLLTAPHNQRFSQVMVNRIWQRFMGRGLVEDLADWEKSSPSHPDLLRWLGRRFVESGYDVKAISQLILRSHAYQRANDPTLRTTSPLYQSPAPRRLTAEQIVDSVFHGTGTPFDLEEVSLDIDSVREIKNAISLGKPRRCWMLASTSNERDRPSLSLPRITAVTTVLKAYGWRGSRQDPRSIRDTEPNILQPAILANGAMTTWLTRLSDRHQMTSLALEDQPVERLIDRVFLRLLTRSPTAVERQKFVQLLADGYETRVIPQSNRPAPVPVRRQRERYVSWSNHVDGPANSLAMKKEAAARRGDPPTKRLEAGWRLRMEDFLWAVLNSPEWMYSP